MATTDSISTTHASQIKTQVDWTATHDSASNSSTVTATLKIYYGYTISASAPKACTININGNARNFSVVLGTFTGWKTLGSHTVTIQHPSGGGATTFSLSGSCAVQVQLTSYGFVGTVSTSSSSQSLPALGSPYKFTVPSTVTTGVEANYVGSGTGPGLWYVYWTLGSNTFETINRPMGTLPFTVPPNWLSDRTSGTMTVLARLYYNGALLYESTHTTKVNVPSTTAYYPSTGTFSVSKGGQSALSAYVQGKNTATLTLASASPGTGATISSVRFTVGSVTRTVTANTSGAYTSTFSLTTAGSTAVKAVVTDSRGRTKTVTASSITVYAYAPPKITAGPTADRCTSTGVVSQTGTYAKVAATYSLGTTIPGLTLTTQRAYHRAGTLKLGPKTLTSGTSAVLGDHETGGAFSEENNYTIEVEVIDNLGGKDTKTVTLSSMFVTMDFKKGGTGIAFGKIATLDHTFETDFALRANNGIEVTGGLTSHNNIYGLSGLDIAGDSLFRGAIHAPAGYSGQRLPSGANLNDYTTPGVWYEHSNANVEAMSNTPPTNIAGCLVVLPSAGTIQYWHDYNTNAWGRTWRRRFYNGWSAWEHYDGQVIGGNGSNGYVLFPGGIQICWYNTTITQAIDATYGGMYIGNHTWTFPRAFTQGPVVSVGTFQWGSGASWGTCYASGPTQAQLRAFDPISRAAGSTVVRATAIGYGV